MKTWRIALLGFLIPGLALGQDAAPAKPDVKKTKEAKEAAAFKFNKVEYFQRFSDKDLYEHTPADQEDLEAWSDMVSLNYYRSVKDGDGLASVANAVLQNYKKAGGAVIKTSSVPRTEEKPAEHLIVIAFARPTFREIAFARFRIQDGVGTSIIYSHRTYGEKAKAEMLTWAKDQPQEVEKQLMEWTEMPAVPAAK